MDGLSGCVAGWQTTWDQLRYVCLVARVQELQTPRVALLFLTKGELFHEPTWRLWFESGGWLYSIGFCAWFAIVNSLRSAWREVHPCIQRVHPLSSFANADLAAPSLHAACSCRGPASSQHPGWRRLRP